MGTELAHGIPPKECQVLHVTNKKKPVKSQYNIDDHLLVETDTAKYLGVGTTSAS